MVAENGIGDKIGVDGQRLKQRQIGDRVGQRTGPIVRVKADDDPVMIPENARDAERIPDKRQRRRAE